MALNIKLLKFNNLTTSLVYCTHQQNSLKSLFYARMQRRKGKYIYLFITYVLTPNFFKDPNVLVCLPL